MKKYFIYFLLCASLTAAAQTKEYKVVKVFHIASAGGWDYLATNDNKLYVSHGTQVNILSEANGDSLGVVSNTPGVHGIAFDNALGRGYTSNGRGNDVSVFDLKNGAVLAHIRTGENPDAIFFESFTHTVITCNGRGKSLSLIDPKVDSVIATIDVGGKPETAVSDGQGRLFVNLEDRNEIAVVDLEKKTVSAHWPLGAEGPTGLAIDTRTRRLFAGCDNFLVVIDATTGKPIARLPIGEGCDGVAFDPSTKTIFTANGGSGTMTAIRETSANSFKVLGNYPTKRGARTITFDEAHKQLFLPTADFDSSRQPGERPRPLPGTFQVLVVE